MMDTGRCRRVPGSGCVLYGTWRYAETLDLPDPYTCSARWTASEDRVPCTRWEAATVDPPIHSHALARGMSLGIRRPWRSGRVPVSRVEAATVDPPIHSHALARGMSLDGG
ncbi:hypothetical protein OPV22_013460 [Ensete ventricosum]|uniref:Uncharacterized protein n=1 Tax=Ensete ventricosum TaxID=4639 RepID=A0AAV8PI87_ENSVE|nr:hypothetical protein OPV22_013460 [Ensete ventricosum]